MSESPNRHHDGSRRLGELSQTQRHGLLASERRRLALDILETKRGAVPLDELAALVATEEHDLGNPTNETIQRTTVNLHHVHLPKLDDMGIVHYDADANHVTAIEGASVP